MAGSSSSDTCSEEEMMLDLIFLVATIFLFWLSVVYVRRCDRI